MFILKYLFLYFIIFDTVAVSHEKGKITVLQLSALLKQADSTKKKLTLSRLSSAPIPFTVLSVTGNPCNEDFLAVCGLKVGVESRIYFSSICFIL